MVVGCTLDFGWLKITKFILFPCFRVLTHSDDTFYEICKPNLNKDNLKVEEDKMKISWMPADIERWLHTGTRSTRSQRAIDIDSYEVGCLVPTF